MTNWRSEELKQFWAPVAERLKLTRHLLGISEQQAADALLITLRTYRKWERNEPHRNNHAGVFNFGDRYGLEYCWLLFGPEHGQPPRFRPRLVA